MRPRANTISHVDQSAMQMLAAANAVTSGRMPQAHHNRHPSLIGLPLHGFDHTFGGMAAAMGHRGTPHGLPKIETTQSNLGPDLNGLRTAPPMPLHSDFDFDQFLYQHMSSSTINPNALHYNDSPPSMAMDTSAFNSMMDLPSSQPLDDSFDWLTGFENQMSINENAMEESSPSALSTTSQSGISDVMLDGSNTKAPAGTSAMWQSSIMGPPQMPNPFGMDLNGPVFPDLLNGAPLSPQPASASQKTNDPYFFTPPPSMSSVSPSFMTGLNSQNVHHTLSFAAGPDTPSSVNGGNHGTSPVTTITDATRTVIVNALSQCPPFGGRKPSFSSQTSPQSPGTHTASEQAAKKVPSVEDLQRFVGAFLAYFHPHMPFLHLPTLSFDPHSPQDGFANSVGGSGCLILSMASIGALYEKNNQQSLELFDMAKKMILFYLEERRKSNLRKADNRRSVSIVVDNTSQSASEPPSVPTPLWLVQAMLLNVVYGHNCGDKTAGDIASTHSAALVSLADAANLLKPASQDTPMADDGWVPKSEKQEQAEWLQWKATEERKRTLYAVFVMSSLLVSAYNQPPALTNSEIFLELPCDEDLFAAESSAVFAAKGGTAAANHNRMTFHDALGELLRTNERQQQMAMNSAFAFSVDGSLPHSDLKPSTFGCLILINALHNYIWETRQRHHNKTWTNEETEKMHRHIEPALKAWQAAWASNPHHSVERPNPFGLGPLSADSIPLLDLAYVRLFVNLSRSKEKFWQRDWDGMAEELSQGNVMFQHAESSPANHESSAMDSSEMSVHSSVFAESPATQASSGEFAATSKGSDFGGSSSRDAPRREKHLRKAASYAADSLAMSDKLGVTFADCTSRELPLQSAMCAFDCAQVLAEWVATLQDRVGRYVGILGQKEVNYTELPAMMVLEEEDVKLLKSIEEILVSAESKIGTDEAGYVMSMDGHNGYATRILRITAHYLSKGAIWPVTHLKAQCLATHANHTRARAEKSILQTE